MKFSIISIGHKMPPWCKLACEDYLARLQHFVKCDLIELPVSNKEEEGRKILQKIKDHTLITLEIQGANWSTLELSKKIAQWQLEGNNVAFVIGGPDGLSTECLARANARWSLSALTLPHMLARVVVVEQLYRGMSVLANHPYHRE